MMQIVKVRCRHVWPWVWQQWLNWQKREKQSNQHQYKTTNDENHSVFSGNVWLWCTITEEGSRQFRISRTGGFHGQDWWVIGQCTMAKTECELLSHVKSCKLRYFGHTMRYPHDSIESRVMMGLVESIRECVRLRNDWVTKITKWTGLSGGNLLRATRDSRHWSALNR